MHKFEDTMSSNINSLNDIEELTLSFSKEEGHISTGVNLISLKKGSLNKCQNVQGIEGPSKLLAWVMLVKLSQIRLG